MTSTTHTLPKPFTPPEMDVRHLDCFLLNVTRLVGSELVAISTGDEFKAATLLWCRAWKEVPGGSLPNDDTILASFSGAGENWQKVKRMALHRFVLCSDGRLYHKVLCEDVRRAWAIAEQERAEKEGAAIRKLREREDRARMFAKLAPHGIRPPWDTPTRELRKLSSELPDDPQPPVTPVTRGRSTGHAPVTVTGAPPLDSPLQVELRKRTTLRTPESRPESQKEESKESSISARARSKRGGENIDSGTGFGTGNGKAAFAAGSTTIADPLDRLARFKAKIAQHLGPRGWDIVESAANRADPHHDQCFFLCKQVAKQLKKGWPRLWFGAGPAAPAITPLRVRSTRAAPVGAAAADLVENLRRRVATRAETRQ